MQNDKFFLIRTFKDFPGGAVVGNSSANAGDTGSTPGPGVIPHAVEQLGPCATATEPVLWSPRATASGPACHNCWSPCAWSLSSATGEPTTMRGLRTATRSGPRSPQLEPAHSNEDPTHPKSK